jgi:uncharacterized protein (DUF302 family)|uniref:DUF302 domain-containing protein n=1 Tax=Roseihalotalea indica TaxID=2867963 RepID=A0AA49GKF3_9BACT|nr:DUF302 domain-containing protein [Tunicatimonas sp. TK19036]
MKYYHEKKLKNISFDEAIERVTDALKEEGFGILTEIDVKETLKKKLDEDFRPYRILGACNPPFAHKALLAEDKIGAMLPCNVIVQQSDDGIEVAAVDPVASMQAVDNKELAEIAKEIQSKLRSVIESL